MKNCPYCGKAMSSGHLFSPRSCAVYWLPTGVELESWIVSTKSVQERGGVVLGEASKFGFIAKRRMVSYYCKECKCFISI